jgi:probable rRNA maturation factor
MKLLWQNTTKQPLAMYKRLAQEHLDDVVDHCQCPHSEVAITIVSRRKMKQFNATYRNLNEPTDVLTFPGDDTYLGDIIICYDVVVEKAAKLDQTATEYMRFCIVHGLLHAVGYDHQTDAQYQEMMELQYQLMERRSL